jgi:DNA polymerase-3 subunit delta
MSTVALKTLREALKRNSFDAAYYICGEDEFQKEDAVKQIIAVAVDPAVRDFNLDVQRAQEIDPKSLDALVSSMPMMAERRVVAIRDVGALRKEARRAVERYLETPSPGVLLLLVESAGGKTDKDLRRITTVLEFEPLTPDRVPRWIAHHARTELQTEISPAAAELLHSAVGNDLHQLVAELDKLASFSNGGEISEEAVTAVVGIRRGETIADLLDAIARRDIKQALTLTSHVLTQPKNSGVSIVMALSTQTVALAWGRAKLDEGLPPGRLQSEYMNLLQQLRSVYTGRPWSAAASAWASATPAWDRPALERAADALLAADMMLKETRYSSEEQVLNTLILTVCSGSEHRIAA